MDGDGSSCRLHSASVGLPAGWEEKAPSPCLPTLYLQGIGSMPCSPNTFSDCFEDILSATIPQDPMVFQLTTFSELQTAEQTDSMPIEESTRSHHQPDQLAMSSTSRANVAASKQRKPLSRHQIYRLNIKGKAKFKNLSHQIQNEHIKMLNQELLRMTAEVKAKDEQLSHLLSENHLLRKQNQRLKLSFLLELED